MFNQLWHHRMNVISHFVRCGQMSDSTVCPSKFFSISSFSKINLKLRWDQWVLIALLLTLWIIKKSKACITTENNSGQSTLVFIRTRPNQWLINKIYFRIGVYSLSKTSDYEQQTITLQIADQGRSNLHVILLTMILICDLRFYLWSWNSQVSDRSIVKTA